MVDPIGLPALHQLLSFFLRHPVISPSFSLCFLMRLLMAGMRVGYRLRYAWKELRSAPHHSECCHWHVRLDWRAWPLKICFPQVATGSKHLRHSLGVPNHQRFESLNEKVSGFLPSFPFHGSQPLSPGQLCGADVSALVLRLLGDSDNVMLNGKALNVLAKSSWPRGLQLLQSMVRRKVGAMVAMARDRLLTGWWCFVIFFWGDWPSGKVT